MNIPAGIMQDRTLQDFDIPTGFEIQYVVTTEKIDV
jgi:hypothetical protein